LPGPSAPFLFRDLVCAPVNYEDFFEHLTGHRPFPYQRRLATGDWPELIDVPTGLGKTDAVIVAWLHRLLEGGVRTGRRLAYCLPMRVLVEQTVRTAEQRCTAAAGLFRSRELPVPSVHPMLGGFVDELWEERPEAPAILVGTQDMLLSRALARGYGMGRAKWPVHFGLLHNDCTWVLDETQLMGVGVETSAQLQGLREQLGTLGETRTIWMSATLGRSQLDTIDHAEPEGGFSTLSLDESDRDEPLVRRRTAAAKPLKAMDLTLAAKELKAYSVALAQKAGRAHEERGELTLVVVNTVERAQRVYIELCELGIEPVALVHSRFRPADRRRHEELLYAEGTRVVVATQAVEAGLDVSSRTLITEIAPWPSLVQRLGRCNRYGEDSQACAYWVDLDCGSDESLALPYDAVELDEARRLIESLSDAGPESLSRVPHAPRHVTRPVLRRRDLLDLFDTTPDLLGNDVDVSRFVRDGEDTDVLVYYRDLAGDDDPAATAPARDELVRVSISRATKVVKDLENKRKSVSDSERKWRLQPWTLSPLSRSGWTRAERRVHPGQVLLLDRSAGGYDANLGWTGEVLPPRPVDPVPTEPEATPAVESLDDDPRSHVGRWVDLTTHLGDVATEAESFATGLALPEHLRRAVTTAAAWHDLGKAHREFQRRLTQPVHDDPELAPPGEGPWAKSSHSRRPPRDSRRFFRHELASALAWLQAAPNGPDRDLVAYLIAAHHGKVRLSIRSVPGERRPDGPERLFARGVWHGDRLPEVALPDGSVVGPIELDLSPMQMGEGSWLERTLGLRDDPDLGPFRLGYLEAVVRIADWRASAKERGDA